jgi:AcrR family transcriptional regulator
MSYPKKISRETILDSAMAHIEAHGVAELSMRTLATALGVTPNALYRYFTNKAELEYALAEAGGHLMLTALKQAAADLPPLLAIAAVAKAYFQFARSQPQLYAIKMRYCNNQDGEPQSYDAVWAFVMGLAEGLHTPWDPQDLALSLWAFLHGMVELDRAQLLADNKATTALDVGLQVMLAGLMPGMAGLP